VLKERDYLNEQELLVLGTPPIVKRSELGGSWRRLSEGKKILAN